MVKLRRRDIFADLMENQGNDAHPLRYGRFGSGAGSKISRPRSAKAERAPGTILPPIGYGSLIY